jgi:O-antigen/teichoic acid export membrane protein
MNTIDDWLDVRIIEDITAIIMAVLAVRPFIDILYHIVQGTRQCNPLVKSQLSRQDWATGVFGVTVTVIFPSHRDVVSYHGTS